MTFKKILRNLFGLGPVEATLAERAIIDAADSATGGVAGKAIDLGEAIDSEVKRRKQRKLVVGTNGREQVRRR